MAPKSVVLVLGAEEAIVAGMPELPDIVVYVEHLAMRVVGVELQGIRFKSPFLLRTALPPIQDAFGQKVVAVSRMGKRIVFELSKGDYLVLHLMIAGRLHWKPRGVALQGKIGLAAFDFPSGSLVLTEASSKKRASLHFLRGRHALEAMNRGGLETLESDEASFRRTLTAENHTVKRALTDPRLFSGIGNSYSDEILHRARLSPVKMTQRLDEAESSALYAAARAVLSEWTQRLREEAGGEFPEKVTAFREGMAVHGRYGQPCPVCGAPVQRIVYAENETNYCARCQTGGKLLADRSLSRLLRADWPKSLEELEEMRTAGSPGPGSSR